MLGVGCGDRPRNEAGDTDEDSAADPGLLCDGSRELEGTLTEREECAVAGSISVDCGLPWTVTEVCEGTGPPDAQLCVDAQGDRYLRVHESWSAGGDAAGGSARYFDESGGLVYVYEWMTGFGEGWSCNGEFVYGYEAGSDPRADCGEQTHSDLCG